MVDLIVVHLQDMRSRGTHINALTGLLIGFNQAPQADHSSSQLLVIHRGGTPEVISPFQHFILVLPGPSVLTPTQWVTDTVRTSPKGMMLSIVSLLQLSPFLGQFPLGLKPTGLLGLLLLFFLMGSLLILLLSCDVG